MNCRHTLSFQRQISISGTTFFLLPVNNFMIMDRDQQNAPQQSDKNPGAEPVAQNPNPRANENIRGRTDETGSESADIEDEVGTEITDGEDA
jgi:hypothetical protein